MQEYKTNIINLIKNSGVKELFEFIKNNPSLKANQISHSLNIPLRTIQRWIKQLKNENKIDFQGSSKIGGYVAR